MKFVLPAALGVATLFFPIPGGAAAVTTVVWEIKKILDCVKAIKESIERLEESDYKSAMQLFKEEVLVKLKNEINPSPMEIKTLKDKSIDAIHKLAETKIEEKLELIKVQIFCTFYLNCYDETQDKVLPFDKIPPNKQGVIRDLINERLFDLQHIATINYLDYYSENSILDKDKQKSKKLVDAIDYIKKVSYPHVIEEDGIHQAGDYVVKTVSLKSYMIPEGNEDATMTSMNVISSFLGPPVTIVSSFYRDFKGTIFLNINLSLPNSEDSSEIEAKLYDSLFVGCMFEKDGDQQAFFIPQSTITLVEGKKNRCVQVSMK